MRAAADGPSEAKMLLALAEVNADQRGSKKREEDGQRQTKLWWDSRSGLARVSNSGDAGLNHPKPAGTGCRERRAGDV